MPFATLQRDEGPLVQPPRFGYRSWKLPSLRRISIARPSIARTTLSLDVGDDASTTTAVQDALWGSIANTTRSRVVDIA
jgi:hypothetical protein